MRTMPFRLAIISPKLRSHQNVDFRQCLRQLLLDQYFIKSKPILHLHYKSLTCVSYSALNIFVARSFRFYVLIAENCYPSSFVIESALYRVLGECLIRRNETSSSFSSFCRVKISVDVFPLNLGPDNNSTLPNIVFICAKSNALFFRHCSGKMNQLIVNQNKPTVFASMRLHLTTQSDSYRLLLCRLGKLLT